MNLRHQTQRHEVQYFVSTIYLFSFCCDTSYQNYTFINTVKVCNSLNPQPLPTARFHPVSAVIYHTGQAGSALCTAARASTWILSACSEGASPPGTRQ